MYLEAAQSISAKNATEDDILNAFADDHGRGEFIILFADNDSFIQAAGELDDPYTLEYHDSSGKHFIATAEVTKEEVQVAFLDYLRNGTQWRESRSWHEMKSSKGCFTVFLLTIAMALGILVLMKIV